jgi:elongation factor G
VYVNKLDRDGAAFGRTVKEIASRLRGWPALCQIPWFEGGKGKFVGVGDVVNLRGLRWGEGGNGKQVQMLMLPELQDTEPTMAEELKKARVALVELLSEHDETMVEEFLGHNEDHLAIPAASITASLRRCTLPGTGAVIPVFAGASFRNIGVQPLLDAVVDLLPSPEERQSSEARVGETRAGLDEFLDGRVAIAVAEPDRRKIKRKLPPTSVLANLEACALAFKVVADARRGVLVYVRVYSGQINRNALLWNTSLQVGERAQRMLQMYASDAVEIGSIAAGQIGVIAGLKHARTGDTLVVFSGPTAKNGPPAPANMLQLRPIDVPPPVFFAAVEPHSLSEEKAVAEALALLLREDPSLHVTVDEDSGQTLLSGMGELHLEIARDRLVGDFKAKASMGAIEIGYRECVITDVDSVRVEFDRDVAGKRSRAGCSAALRPLNVDDRASDVATDIPLSQNDVDGDSDANETTHTMVRDGNSVSITLPASLAAATALPALSAGALAALARGPRYSFPLHATHVDLVVNGESDVFGADTTPGALAGAARLAVATALKQAAANGNAGVMEPVMNVSVSCPEEVMGSVVADISAARGGHVVALEDVDVGAAETNDEAVMVTRVYAPKDPFEREGVVDDGVGRRQRVVKARVPLQAMVGYLKHLRSLTAGRGTFVMSVDCFERMSGQRLNVIGLGQ